jgi:hypothetical protein
MRAAVTILLAAWLALVVLLGATGSFTTPDGEPPVPILLGAVGPVVLFLLAYALSGSVRAFVHGVDLRLATTIQAWRFAGIAFIALYTYNILPGSFAWPAGLGDIAIGLTAPWVALALTRRPAFAASRVFVVWNLLGMLDLVSAIAAGGASSALATGTAGEVTTRPMSLLPLVLVPGYFVPLLFILHVVALVQSRRMARSESTADWAGTGAARHPACA